MDKSYDKQITDVGLRVKKLRMEKGVTQQNLAGMCDVDIRTIQRIEKGEFGMGLHILFALSEALEVEASDILHDIKRGVV